MINFPTVFLTVKNMQDFINSNFSNLELQRETENIFFKIYSVSKEVWDSILERENRNTELHQWLILFKHIQIRHLSKEFLCLLDEKSQGSSSYIYDPAYRHESNNDNLLDIFVHLKSYHFSYNKFKFFKEIGVDFYYTSTNNFQLLEFSHPFKYDSIIEKMIQSATDNEIDEIIKHQPEFFPNLFQEYEIYNEKYECKFDKPIPDSKKANLILSVRKPLLLEEFLKHGIDFKTYTDENGRNILFNTCSKNPSLFFVKYLLENGVNKNQHTLHGNTTKTMIEKMLKHEDIFIISEREKELYNKILQLL